MKDVCCLDCIDFRDGLQGDRSQLALSSSGTREQAGLAGCKFSSELARSTLLRRARRSRNTCTQARSRRVELVIVRAEFRRRKRYPVSTGPVARDGEHEVIPAAELRLVHGSHQHVTMLHRVNGGIQMPHHVLARDRPLAPTAVDLPEMLGRKQRFELALPDGIYRNVTECRPREECREEPAREPAGTAGDHRMGIPEMPRRTRDHDRPAASSSAAASAGSAWLPGGARSNRRGVASPRHRSAWRPAA